MKALKWIVFVLIGLMLAFLIFSAVQDNQMIIEIEINIDAEAELVYQELLQVENWKEWDAFNEIDNNLISSSLLDTPFIGSTYEWSSKHPIVGNGRRVVQHIQENTAVQFELELEDWPYSAIDKFNIDPVARHIVLTRRYEGKKTPFYLNFLNLFTEPIIKVNLNKDLENFKTYIENLEPEEETEVEEEPFDENFNPFNLEITSFEGFQYIGITKNCTQEELASTLSNLLTELSIYLDIFDGIKAISDPITIFNQRNGNQLIIKAAIPVEGNAIESGDIKVGQLPPSEVIQGIYYGAYENAAEIYLAIQEYAAQQNLELTANPWEVYTSSASGETKAVIYYPIK